MPSQPTVNERCKRKNANAADGRKQCIIYDSSQTKQETISFTTQEEKRATKKTKGRHDTNSPR